MFELPEETIALRDMARDFASEKIAPHAQRWDEERHLPVDVLREAAALGMAGLYVREESGGTGLTRLDAATVFEALAYGCPTISAFLSIHNMVAWMIDRFGNDAQRAEHLPSLLTMQRIARPSLAAVPTPRRWPPAPRATMPAMCSMAASSSFPAPACRTSI